MASDNAKTLTLKRAKEITDTLRSNQHPDKVIEAMALVCAAGIAIGEARRAKSQDWPPRMANDMGKMVQFLFNDAASHTVTGDYFDDDEENQSGKGFQH